MTSDTRDSGYTVHPPLLGRDMTYSDENEYAYVEDYQRFNTAPTPGVQQGPTHRRSTFDGSISDL